MSNTQPHYPKADACCQVAIACIAELQNAPLKQVADRLTDLYDAKRNKGAGVYAIYENDRLMYIGRSHKGGIVQRLQGHYTSPDSATLAVKLTPTQKKTDPKLKQARERVKKMQVRFVEVRDVNIQALTETLATIELNPPYNDLETH